MFIQKFPNPPPNELTSGVMMMIFGLLTIGRYWGTLTNGGRVSGDYDDDVWVADDLKIKGNLRNGRGLSGVYDEDVWVVDDWK